MESVEYQGSFEEAAVVARVEAVNQPLVSGGLVEARLGAVFNGAHSPFVPVLDTLWPLL